MKPPMKILLEAFTILAFSLIMRKRIAGKLWKQEAGQS
jgi:hypothetical protein